MRELRVECRVCGEVTLPASEVTLTGAHDPDQVMFVFHCPECGTACRQVLGLAAGRMLLMGGAGRDPVAAPERPPLSLADLDTLRELLDRPDFVSLMSKTA
jgi:hypothetical protein